MTGTIGDMVPAIHRRIDAEVRPTVSFAKS
jgi:hypothetical protein